MVVGPWPLLTGFPLPISSSSSKNSRIQTRLPDTQFTRLTTSSIPRLVLTFVGLVHGRYSQILSSLGLRIPIQFGGLEAPGRT